MAKNKKVKKKDSIEISENDYSFDEIKLDHLICFNLLKIIKKPFIQIMEYLITIEGADPIAIHKKTKEYLKLKQESLKRKLKKLQKMDIIQVDDLNDPPLYKLTDLGTNLIKIYKKNNLNLNELPNFSYFHIQKLTLLSRLYKEKEAIDYNFLRVKYDTLPPKQKVMKMIDYLIEKNLVYRFNSGAFEITDNGKKLIKFYWDLYEYYENDFEFGNKLKTVNSEAKISFDPVWFNFNFSKTDTYNLFLLISRLIKETSVSIGNLRSYSRLTPEKLNELIKILEGMKLIEIHGDRRNKLILSGKNFQFFWNFQKIAKDWKEDLEDN